MGNYVSVHKAAGSERRLHGDGNADPNHTRFADEKEGGISANPRTRATRAARASNDQSKARTTRSISDNERFGGSGSSSAMGGENQRTGRVRQHSIDRVAAAREKFPEIAPRFTRRKGKGNKAGSEILHGTAHEAHLEAICPISDI